MDDEGFPLHAAAARNNVEAVAQALADGLPVDGLDSKGLTALCRAIDKDATECVDLLIAQGANVNFVHVQDDSKTCLMMAHSARVTISLLRAGADAAAIDSVGNTVLITACSMRGADTDAAWVKALLEAGADPSAQNAQGETAFLSVAQWGCVEVLQILLDAGADIHHRNSAGETAIIVAGGQQVDVLQFLLDAGANVNDASKAGITPLMNALPLIDSGIRFLVEHGASVNAVAQDGTTALMKLFELLEVEGFVDPDNVRCLLEAGAYPYATDPQGRTALHWLADAGHNTDSKLPEYISDPTQASKWPELEAVRLLVAAGVGIDRTNSEGHTALHIAAVSRNALMAKQLVDSGANIKAVAPDGKTALMFAAQAGAMHLCTYLLQAGATTENTTGEGQTALMLASGSVKAGAPLITALLKGGANVHAKSHVHGNALCRAIDAGRLDVVNDLLQAGAKCEPVLIESTWTSPLCKALLRKRWDIAEVLIKAGADVNAASVLVPAPLSTAADIGFLQGLQGLLNAGAALDAVDSDGRTALLTAAASSQSDSVRLLISRGANVHIADHVGSVPLHEAASKCDVDAVTMLIDAGADVNCSHTPMRPDTFLSPLHYAIVRASSEVVKILVESGARILFHDVSSTFPPLILAMARGSGVPSLLLDVLFGAGACVHDTLDTGHSCLAYAITTQNSLGIQKCLDAGASPFDLSNPPASTSTLQELLVSSTSDLRGRLRAWTPGTPAQTSARWNRRRHAISHWNSHWSPPPEPEA